MRSSPTNLLSIIATTCAGALLLGSAVAGVCRHILRPDEPLATVFTDVLLPAAVVGVVIAFACWTVFDRLVLRPAKGITRHLYDVGMGRLRPLALRSNVAEIRPLIDGINLVVRRLEPPTEREIALQFERIIESLREVATAIAPDSPGRAAEIMDDIAVLERTFLAGGRTGSMAAACM
jgi:hypothetical protein